MPPEENTYSEKTCRGQKLGLLGLIIKLAVGDVFKLRCTSVGHCSQHRFATGQDDDGNTHKHIHGATRRRLLPRGRSIC